MYKRHYLDTLSYPISPNDVILHEKYLQMIIYVFSFFNDECRARHFLVISRKNYELGQSYLFKKLICTPNQHPVCSHT